MNFDDILRGFFGFGNRPKHPLDQRPSDIENENGDCGCEDVGDFFSTFHEEMQRQMEQLNRQMEDMFHTRPNDTNRPDINSPGVFVFDFPHYGGVGQPRAPLSPRDQMLKQPDEDIPPGSAPAPSQNLPGEGEGSVQPYQRPSPFGRLFDVPIWDMRPLRHTEPSETDGRKLRSSGPPDLDRVDPRVFTQQTSFSTQTVRGAGGRVEHRKVIRRPDGKVEETVTRTLGDKSHTSTVVTDSRGERTQTDTFINMPQNDLSTFNKLWDGENQGGQSTPRLPPADHPSPLPSNPSEEDGILKKIFNAFKPKS